jgi:serine/threonine protein kinase/tetratricopeptide (TPR) repeat protein
MTPERWQLVEEVFAEALERDPVSRANFVVHACGNDNELREEVESLMRALENGSRDVFESPAIDAVGRLRGSRDEKMASGRRLGAYEILAPLGAGGMGAVYVARDSRLDRNVALKVISASVAANSAARARFEREAKAVAALSHPNIVAIFDFGVQDGIPYAATELLEGETLRARIERGPVPTREALDYALQISRGLSAAHEKGIVHRDLKPENVFVGRDARVRILDFGLSKHFGDTDSAEERATPNDTTHTQPGDVMGTLGYMSPEQARGLPVDPRSDIFSLGAILHEMLTARRAFVRETPEKTIAAIVNDDPDLVPEPTRIAGSVAAIVRRCLEKNPSDRYAAARDVEFALAAASTQRLRQRRWIATTLGFALLASVAFFLLRYSSAIRRQWADAPIKRVAVLPFESDDGSEGRVDIADGLASEVRDRLASLPGLQVVTYGASSLLSKGNQPLQEVARKLNVSYLLTAKVRTEESSGQGSIVNVSAELVELTGSGPPIVKWREPFRAPAADLVALPASIASATASGLGSLVSAQDARLSERPPVKPAAYELYLRGQEMLRGAGQFDRATIEKDLELFERVVALDPGFAEAWAQIANLSAVLYSLGVSPRVMRDRAELALENAQKLGADLPLTFTARAAAEALFHNDMERTRDILQQGLRITPTDAGLLNMMGDVEIELGRIDDAAEHYQQARVFDPTSEGLGPTLGLLHRYPEALEIIERARELAPLNLQIVMDEVNIYLTQGDLAGARTMMHRVPPGMDRAKFVAYMANEPIDYDVTWALDGAQRKLLLKTTPSEFGGDRGEWALCLAVVSLRDGDISTSKTYAEEARRNLEELKKVQPRSYQVFSGLGLALALLGQKEEAIQAGEHATALTRYVWQSTKSLSNLVRIRLLVGDYERALDDLERVVKLPQYWSPGWLKIDPDFDPVRTDPRFQRLVKGA